MPPANPLKRDRPAAAIMPLPQGPVVHPDWSTLGLPNTGLIMIYDDLLCVDCPQTMDRACTLACNEAHGLSGYVEGTPPGTCVQCESMPCAVVCPVENTVTRNALGAVLIDQELCIGCRFCEEVCPEHALRYVETFGIPAVEYRDYSPEHPSGALYHTVAKCTFCTDKIAQGKLPICASSCPKSAIYVGNLDRNTVTNGRVVARLSDFLTTRTYAVQQTNPGQGSRILHLH